MILVRRTYTPMPGGGGLLSHIRDLKKATVEAGFPPLEIHRQVMGPHGTVVTVQRWPSMAAYEESRSQVRGTGPIKDIHSQIFPTLASTHVTELYEEIN